MSKESREKLSISHKLLGTVPPSRMGAVPWNKGIKSPLMAKEKHPQWKAGKPNCKDCGKKLTQYTAKFCILCYRKGERGSNWKGGITPINKLIRVSKEYQDWRAAVFERDDYTCVLCGARSAKGRKVILHADHIKPFAYFPELRIVVGNGRTLCIDCHKKTDTFGKQSKKGRKVLSWEIGRII